MTASEPDKPGSAALGQALDVFFYEAFQEEQEALRNCLQGTAIRAGFTPAAIQELGAGPPPAPLISIRTQSLIPEDWANRMSGILTRSTGYDHVLDYRNRTGTVMPCGYLPLYCNRAVAETAMLLWMALMRKLPRQLEHFQAFNRDGLTGSECAGKTLLVVGVGHIGSEVVRIGKGLGMRVLGVDIIRKHPDVDYVELENGLAAADVIVCAMNLTASNRGFFNYPRLKDIKPGTIFVNIARGELSPTGDLKRLLDEGLLGGVGLDVYDREIDLAATLRSGKPVGHPETKAVLELARRDNAILTPHNAFNTVEAVGRKALHSIRQIERFLAQGDFIWTVPAE
jgi:D-lactate dehydrogenase